MLNNQHSAGRWKFESLIMGSNPFDVMIDEWSFEIAQLTHNRAGLVSA